MNLSFQIVLIHTPIIYDRYGTEIPDGRAFVLKEELERNGGLDSYINKVKTGAIKIEPLVIRANAGDQIELCFSCHFPQAAKSCLFQLITHHTASVCHISLVAVPPSLRDNPDDNVNDNTAIPAAEFLTESINATSELQAVFFHDCLPENPSSFRGAVGVLLIEETGAVFLNAKTETPLSFGSRARIRRSNGTIFREFALFPQTYGKFCGINYRTESMQKRLDRHENPSYLLSSQIHSDPDTPILETYSGDELILRILYDTCEPHYPFRLHGIAWTDSSKNVTDGHKDIQTIHIQTSYVAGDYLYYFGESENIWLGLWGILRAHPSPVTHLRPLPSAEHASIRKYEIAAVCAPPPEHKNTVFHRHNRKKGGYRHPILLVPLEEAKKASRFSYRPKPLILRANSGEWIEVTLHNMLDSEQDIPAFHCPQIPASCAHSPSLRISLSPQSLSFDPVLHSGINLGQNSREQTVAPGKVKTYLWYAGDKCRTSLLQSFGDIGSHCFLGLSGIIVVESPSQDTSGS